MYFKQFLDRENQKEKLDDTKAKDTGIVLYLNIFNFQEVVDIIKQKLDITDSDEEIISTEKILFCNIFQLRFTAFRQIFLLQYKWLC